MKKIPTIFERDWEGNRSRVLDVPNPECAWVFAGEGQATKKFDGAAVLIKDGLPFKRRELKAGAAEPPDFLLAATDEVTGERVGWVPIGSGPEDRWFRAALVFGGGGRLPDGTYEAIGPHFQGGVEGVGAEMLVRHGGYVLHPPSRTFEGLREWLRPIDIEGLVFHHQDGRMAKIKKRDFGLNRLPEENEEPLFAGET